jgi:hypothetical protein
MSGKGLLGALAGGGSYAGGRQTVATSSLGGTGVEVRLRVGVLGAWVVGFSLHRCLSERCPLAIAPSPLWAVVRRHSSTCHCGRHLRCHRRCLSRRCGPSSPPARERSEPSSPGFRSCASVCVSYAYTSHSRPAGCSGRSQTPGFVSGVSGRLKVLGQQSKISECPSHHLRHVGGWRGPRAPRRSPGCPRHRGPPGARAVAQLPPGTGVRAVALRTLRCRRALCRALELCPRTRGVQSRCGRARTAMDRHRMQWSRVPRPAAAHGPPLRSR